MQISKQTDFKSALVWAVVSQVMVHKSIVWNELVENSKSNEPSDVAIALQEIMNKRNLKSTMNPGLGTSPLGMYKKWSEAKSQSELSVGFLRSAPWEATALKLLSCGSHEERMQTLMSEMNMRKFSALCVLRLLETACAHVRVWRGAWHSETLGWGAEKLPKGLSFAEWHCELLAKVEQTIKPEVMSHLRSFLHPLFLQSPQVAQHISCETRKIWTTGRANKMSKYVQQENYLELFQAAIHCLDVDHLAVLARSSAGPSVPQPAPKAKRPASAFHFWLQTEPQHAELQGLRGGSRTKAAAEIYKNLGNEDKEMLEEGFRAALRQYNEQKQGNPKTVVEEGPEVAFVEAGIARIRFEPHSKNS